MASLGKIEEFNPTSTNIARYLERLEQYFEANDVPADTAEVNKKRAIHRPRRPILNSLPF